MCLNFVKNLVNFLGGWFDFNEANIDGRRRLKKRINYYNNKKINK